MVKMKKNEYVTPEMEVVEVAIESCILAGSDPDPKDPWGDENANGGTGGL